GAHRRDQVVDEPLDLRRAQLVLAHLPGSLAEHRGPDLRDLKKRHAFTTFALSAALPSLTSTLNCTSLIPERLAIRSLDCLRSLAAKRSKVRPVVDSPHATFTCRNSSKLSRYSASFGSSDDASLAVGEDTAGEGVAGWDVEPGVAGGGADAAAVGLASDGRGAGLGGTTGGGEGWGGAAVA